MSQRKAISQAIEHLVAAQSLLEAVAPVSLELWTNDRIVDALNEAIRSQGATLTEAARSIGIPYRTLQNQLRGNNRVTAEVCLRIAVWLQIDLFGGDQ